MTAITTNVYTPITIQTSISPQVEEGSLDVSENLQTNDKNTETVQKTQCVSVASLNSPLASQIVEQSSNQVEEVALQNSNIETVPQTKEILIEKISSQVEEVTSKAMLTVIEPEASLQNSNIETVPQTSEILQEIAPAMPLQALKPTPSLWERIKTHCEDKIHGLKAVYKDIAERKSLLIGAAFVCLVTGVIYKTYNPLSTILDGKTGVIKSFR